jgi:hypothetical protein
MKSKPLYLIIQRQDISALEKIVIEWMQEGYLPLGAPFREVWEGTTVGFWHQAIYKPL